MANGVAADPQSSEYLSLATLVREKDGSWSVGHVFANGPADLAGLRIEDKVESIDGTVLDPHSDPKVLMNKPSYQIVVRRQGPELTILVNPLRYFDLMTALKKSAPLPSP